MTTPAKLEAIENRLAKLEANACTHCTACATDRANQAKLDGARQRRELAQRPDAAAMLLALDGNWAGGIWRNGVIDDFSEPELRAILATATTHADQDKILSLVTSEHLRYRLYTYACCELPTWYRISYKPTAEQRPDAIARQFMRSRVKVSRPLYDEAEKLFPDVQLHREDEGVAGNHSYWIERRPINATIMSATELALWKVCDKPFCDALESECIVTQLDHDAAFEATVARPSPSRPLPRKEIQ